MMTTDHQTAATPARRAFKRIGGQGALLMAGFAGAQGCSFLRNALLGHWLSQGDFGIAAAITLMLQMVDTLSDVGADRLIIQAPDGEAPRLQATAHAALIARGAVTSLLLLIAAAPVTEFFAIPEATWAFQVIAIAPLIKGFIHLDSRRYQRTLNNLPQVMIELLPQLSALLLTLPALYLSADYSIVVWLALSQAVIALATSHALSERRYAIALDKGYINRLIKFGWPIWLSAFPLVAVYQGDRMIIGGLLGVEDLASYTVAFMITMVPGLLAARIGTALMLPLLSEVTSHHRQFRQRYRIMFELVTVGAATYLTFFMAAGAILTQVAFGPNYSGLATVVTCLAGMWTLRILQSVPGMALMAKGDTRPLLWAGLIRATGLPLAICAIYSGLGLTGAAAAGAGAEALSLIYVINRTSRHAVVSWELIARTSALLIAATASGAFIAITFDGEAIRQILLAMMATVLISVLSLVLMPSCRSFAFDKPSLGNLFSRSGNHKGRSTSATA